MHNFKKLYDLGDLRLFHNCHLQFLISEELSSQNNLRDFIKEISSLDLEKMQSSQSSGGAKSNKTKDMPSKKSKSQEGDTNEEMCVNNNELIEEIKDMEEHIRIIENKERVSKKGRFQTTRAPIQGIKEVSELQNEDYDEDEVDMPCFENLENLSQRFQ